MNFEISNFLRSRIEAGDFPSAVYLVSENGEIAYQDAIGNAVVEPEKIEATRDTIFDLASVTKILVTGLLLAKICESGQLTPEDQIRGFLPEFDRGDKQEITITDILSHRSGFVDWLPFYLIADDRADVIDTLAEADLDYTPGDKVVYSDPGFATMTFLIERALSESLDVTAQREIFEPLGLENTYFNPPAEFRPTIAANETGNEFERQMCMQRGFIRDLEGRQFKSPPANAGGPAFRDEVIWGEVHDGNACFMGGVAAHAGLFSTAEEVFRIAQQFLPEYTKLLKPETCALFRTNLTEGLNEDRSFAFQLASTKDSTAGVKMSLQSFGHNGFTGTSLWIDPIKDRIFVLLTNRTHDHDLPFVNINSVRRRFHDLAVDALDNKTSN